MMPFWAATTFFLGIYSTMIINASDYSHNATDDIKPVKAASIYTVAIVLNNIVSPAYVLMESFKMKWTHAAMLAGVLSYYVLMKVMPSSRNFCKGTIFEK